MTNPTRGPWEVKTYGSKTTLEIRSAIDDGPAIVNWTGFDDIHRKRAENLANAKLMAASPELLGACQAARAWLGERRSEDWPYDQAVNQLIDQLEAAIKKAQ